MVKVLVTGGAGFIGSNFVRHAVAAHPDWQITTLDKLTYAGRLENLQGVIDHPRHTFITGDIADAEVASPLVKASEIVVHFAAETHVDRSLLSAGSSSRPTCSARSSCSRRHARPRTCGDSFKFRPMRSMAASPRVRAASRTNCDRAIRIRRAKPQRTASPIAIGPPTTCRW